MGNESNDFREEGRPGAPINPLGESKCLSCHLTFRNLRQVEEHTHDS